MGISVRFCVSLAFVCVLQLFTAPVKLAAQSQGSNGFDWIGTDPTNIAGQRCFPAGFNPSGSTFAQVTTSWVPPGSTTNKYELKSFRAVSGLIGSNPGTPLPLSTLISTGKFQLSVYESLEKLRTTPDTGFRARYRYENGLGGVSITPTQSCKVYSFGYLYDMPCGLVHADLKLLEQQGRAQFRTATGQPTTVPFELLGSQRYFFAISGYSTDVSPAVCFVRTNFGNAANRSALPNPVISVPMNAAQCAEAGFPSSCLFVLAHGDYYWTVNTEPLCDPARTFVNSTEDQSVIAPFLNPSPDGSLPRTCGGATHATCCERTFAAHSALGLEVALKNRIPTKGVSIPHGGGVTTVHKADIMVEPCSRPDLC